MCLAVDNLGASYLLIIAYNCNMPFDSRHKQLFIAPKFGLGDSIVCNAIYRIYARRYAVIILPVFKNYKKTLKRMLYDVPNIILLPYNNFFAQEIVSIQKQLMKKGNFDVLNLGSNEMGFRENGIRNKIRFDEGFYQQARIDFSARWTDFYYPRRYSEELQLFKELKCDAGEYQFVHEDIGRNFRINKKYLNPNLRVITPQDIALSHNFFNYRLILENASEIHCIESSFAALIESLDVKVLKFAHRYSRPEAKSEMHYEFTYKSDWVIYS